MIIVTGGGVVGSEMVASKGGQKENAGSKEVIEWRAGNSEWKREAVFLTGQSGWRVMRA